MYPLNDYCKANGHELVATYVWNSSTILNYAYSKKVEELLNKYRPTMVLFVVGLNELYAKDLKKRTKAAQKFIEKLGDVNYLWVGPANFDKDNGINAVFEATAAKGKFFRSKDISIPKGSDKRHPSISGYRIWMTSIANHIQNDTSYGFTLNPPKKRGTIIKGKVITANCIAPGWFRTAQNDVLYRDEEWVRSLTERIPLRRPGRADDLDGIVVFLASDASAYVTGQTLLVDGGMSTGSVRALPQAR